MIKVCAYSHTTSDPRKDPRKILDQRQIFTDSCQSFINQRSTLNSRNFLTHTINLPTHPRTQTTDTAHKPTQTTQISKLSRNQQLK